MLTIVQQFMRSRGFFRRVAEQTALARRSSSRAGYQAEWLFSGGGVAQEGIPFSRPTLPEIAGFL